MRPQNTRLFVDLPPPNTHVCPCRRTHTHARTHTRTHNTHAQDDLLWTEGCYRFVLAGDLDGLLAHDTEGVLETRLPVMGGMSLLHVAASVGATDIIDWVVAQLPATTLAKELEEARDLLGRMFASFALG